MSCAAPLVVASPAREVRKTVTVLFCDLVGSTALGEQTDPEALRALLGRYFERMSGIVESHGGTVEKFIGDAVMAVFGVPVAHEDDALRACRAAVEIRDALPALGIEGRIGVNTGEVVTGTAERLVTGDAVNVAARLEQAAAPGEVLIGEATHELVQGAVDAERVEPLVLKGKSQPVQAFRLVAAHEAAERPHWARFVGREHELALIEAAWERARRERRCELLTIVGEAGIGKSHLIAAALGGLSGRVVQGRCLPYGEGITYWPVVEVIKQLDELPADPAAAAALRALLGETSAGTSAEEIAWAFRKLLEQAAPLIVVVDDLQWAEETLLDLLEHVSLLSSGSTILLLCLARPELSERRSSWPVGLRLEPLGEDAVEELIGGGVPVDLLGRIVSAAGGNPLFVTEMLAMAAQTDVELRVPPTLQALLTVRLDQLESAERRVLEAGAVEGEIFHRGAVQALVPEESQVTPRLAALVRKQLIRPDRAQLEGEDGFRFRHLLIRDAAYESQPKATRAELHQRFSGWLEQWAPDLVELDELVGYHLEQAAHFLAELGRPDAAVAERAGGRLAVAGRRALWRDDLRAAASLLARALELTRPLRLDVHLELELAEATHDAPERAAALARTAAERARAAGDHGGEALARLAAAWSPADPDYDEVEALARSVLPLLERARDHAGLVRVWWALADVAAFRCRHLEQEQAVEEALRHARLAGHGRHTFSLGGALTDGPRPADEALRRLDAVLPDEPHPRSLGQRVVLLAMLERFDEAWPLAHEVSARHLELTGRDLSSVLADVATMVGDYPAAVGYRRSVFERWRARPGRGVLSTLAPKLGRSLCALGRYDEAEPLAQLGRELADEKDVISQILWRQVQALVHASRGEHAQAVQLAREAVEISERTDGLNSQGDALYDLGEVLSTAGHREAAASAFQEALDRYERKQIIPLARRTRERLAALQAPTP